MGHNSKNSSFMKQNEWSSFFHSKTEACVTKHGRVKNNSESKNQNDDLLIYITVGNLLGTACGLDLANKHLWNIFQEFLQHTTAAYLST